MPKYFQQLICSASFRNYNSFLKRETHPYESHKWNWFFFHQVPFVIKRFVTCLIIIACITMNSVLPAINTVLVFRTIKFLPASMHLKHTPSSLHPTLWAKKLENALIELKGLVLITKFFIMKAKFEKVTQREHSRSSISRNHKPLLSHRF